MHDSTRMKGLQARILVNEKKGVAKAFILEEWSNRLKWEWGSPRFQPLLGLFTTSILPSQSHQESFRPYFST